VSIVVYIDGQFLPKEEAKVSVFDHGYLYGDGVFEGIRAYNGRVFKLDEHLKRLYDSARSIMLDIPISIQEMEAAVLETLRRNNLRDAYIRLVVSRGIGDLGLDPRKCEKATVVIITDKIKMYPQETYENGLKLVTVPTRRNIPEAINPMIKSLNYLNNILAKLEAIRSGVEEAIMMNNEGYVAECTGDNIFIISNGVLITPPASVGALKGVTRDTVLELAVKAGIPTREVVFTRHELYVADEAFLTGTAAEIIPVVEIDSRPIGSGKPGKLTTELISSYRQLVQSTGTPIY
jgi:branched-chain amino acid aminotransferase